MRGKAFFSLVLLLLSMIALAMPVRSEPDIIPPRYGHVMFAFDNKIWIMAGFEGWGSSDPFSNSVWNSDDGINWNTVTLNAPWDGRTEAERIVFNNQIWFMGGSPANGVIVSDVWYSPDGIDWYEETSVAEWAERGSMGITEYNGRMWLFGGESGGQNKHDVWYSSENGENWFYATLSAPWGTRHTLGACTFDNKMFVMGGSGGGSTMYNDVWYSTDGENWSTYGNAEWVARYGFELLVYDSKMWVIGGRALENGGTTLNDVWNTVDGENWTQVTEHAAWIPRLVASSTVFDNKMWISGGSTGTAAEADMLGDIWYSSDGVNWTQATYAPTPSDWYSSNWKYRKLITIENAMVENADLVNFPVLIQVQLENSKTLDNGSDILFTPENEKVKLNHEIEEFDGENLTAWVNIPILYDTINTKLFVYYGNELVSSSQENATGTWNDNYKGVWHLDSLVNMTGAFTPRYGHVMMTYNNKMWLMGGYDNNYRSDVWYSLNGNVWSLATSWANWPGRSDAGGISFDGKMWIMGGSIGGELTSDVWYSTNGSFWQQVTASAPWSDRSAFGITEYDEKMWIIGGAGVVNLNDVWYSSNGTTWGKTTSSAGWSGRHSLAACTFDGKMWVMGGSGATLYHDVWYTTDGENWSTYGNADWSSRYAFELIVYDNKMWVIGGRSTGVTNDDVWYTTDGENWFEATGDAEWTERLASASVMFDNKMWISAGSSTGSDKLNDVWYSTDGENWTNAIGNIVDSTINQHSGTVEGGMTSNNLVAAKIGAGLDFDGSLNAVNFGDHSDFSPTLNGFTVEGWLNTDDITNDDSTILAKYTDPYEWYFKARNTNIYVIIKDNDTTSTPYIMKYTSGGISIDTWYYVVMTYDGGTSGNAITIYIDGDNVGGTTADWGTFDNPADNNAPMRAAREESVYLNGTLDELRISCKARSPEWVRTTYNNQSSPSTFYTVGAEEELSREWYEVVTWTDYVHMFAWWEVATWTNYAKPSTWYEVATWTNIVNAEVVGWNEVAVWTNYPNVVLPGWYEVAIWTNNIESLAPSIPPVEQTSVWVTIIRILGIVGFFGWAGWDFKNINNPRSGLRAGVTVVIAIIGIVIIWFVAEAIGSVMSGLM